jgi:hypothetical protein
LGLIGRDFAETEHLLNPLAVMKKPGAMAGPG